MYRSQFIKKQTLPPKLPPALSSPLVTKHATCLIKRHLWNKAAKSALIVIDFMTYTGDSWGNRTRLVLAPTIFYLTFYMKHEICWNFLQNPPAVVWISVIRDQCACNASVTKQRSFSSSIAECPDINKDSGITLFSFSLVFQKCCQALM